MLIAGAYSNLPTEPLPDSPVCLSEASRQVCVCGEGHWLCVICLTLPHHHAALMSRSLPQHYSYSTHMVPSLMQHKSVITSCQHSHPLPPPSPPGTSAPSLPLEHQCSAGVSDAQYSQYQHHSSHEQDRAQPSTMGESTGGCCQQCRAR